MTSHRRAILPAVSALAILTGAGLPVIAYANAPAAAAQQQTQAGRPWPQDRSDLKADERLRFGRMDNGMRYVLMRNATPPGQVSLRLHVNAGSLHETDEQQGLAHFTEHMLFNGTENIPENELLRILERLGLQFGADTNAATGFDETFYRLELPRGNDETIDASLRIMREQVSRAQMDIDAINAERDVIVGEARTRDTPALRSLKAQLALLAPGQQVSRRLPIGDLDVIRTAPPQRFIDFYRAYYRPERVTFVAVGDFDVDAMEAKIRGQFEDWRNTYPDGPEPDRGVAQTREPQAAIIVEPGTQYSVSLYRIRPYMERIDNQQLRRENVLRNIGLAVLNRRLGEISRQDNPPFNGAGAGSGALVKSLDSGSITANFNPGGLQRALETIEQEQRRMIQYGPTEAEIQREIADIRTGLENFAAAANTQQTAALAGSIQSRLHGETVPTSPADDLAFFNQVTSDIKVEDVKAQTAKALDGSGPLALVTAPAAIDGGEAEVVRILEASQKVEVQPPAAAAAAEWPYTAFGTPTEPAATKTFEQAGATLYTFPNNVRLIFKQTDFRKDQIMVSVETGLGDLGLPKDRFDPLNIAPSIFTLGGLGRLTVDEMNRVLAGKTYGAGMNVGTEEVTLTGSTRPQDLELQLQVLAAFFTDAALRGAPLEQIKAIYPQILEQTRATVGGAMSLDAAPILAGGDRRATQPTLEEVNALTAEAIKASYERAVSQGPIDITVVGDISAEAVVAAVGKTFGALPTRSALPQATPESQTRSLPQPRTEPYRFTHTGKPEQAGVAIYWAGTDALGDRRESRLVGLMTQVLELRVMEEIREKQALTYSPGVNSTASPTYPGYGYITVSGDVDASKIDAFRAAVDKVVASFAETPVTEDELNRARAPMIEAQRRSQAANGFWLGGLSSLQRYPEREALMLNYIPTLESFTPADVQAAAQKYLRKDRSWSFEVVHAGQ
ncbi:MULTISPECIES: M16 family metallopeptidase [unclassified Brevundimonas]|uniref:M16 family metallopeptidase n=1 Tax=unclassified Brevundimonas TaxID=2622653 RepID=UPI0025C62469|nr:MULTISPECIES: M16 family metallopeptidase [unclassified Brevundimonas]